jgi:mannitol-specific phosphotransferase system IIBC component
MDALKPEVWKQQWEAFMSAPYVQLPLLAAAAVLTWWICSQLYKAKTEGLQQQLAVREERLKAVEEKVGMQKEAREEAERRFVALKTEIGSGSSSAGLNERVAALETALASIKVANTAVEGTLRATEGADSFQVKGRIH